MVFLFLPLECQKDRFFFFFNSSGWPIVHYVVKDDLEFLISLPLPFLGWDYGHGPPVLPLYLPSSPTGCVTSVGLLSFSVSHFFSYPRKISMAPTTTVLRAAPMTNHVLSIVKWDYFRIGYLGVKLAEEGDAIACSSLRSQCFLQLLSTQ